MTSSKLQPEYPLGRPRVARLGLPDLANKNIACPIKLKLKCNFLVYLMKYVGHTFVLCS